MADETTQAPDVHKPLVCEKKYDNQTPTHTMCLTDDPEAIEVPLTMDVKRRIVDQHNQLRASIKPAAANMQKMVNMTRLFRH